MTKLLPKYFPKYYTNPSKWRVAITSSLIDCFIGDWLYMSTLIFFGGYWETKSLAKAAKNVKEKIIPTMFANWSFWFLDIIMYRFIPIHLRATFDHSCSTVFSGIFSFIENDTKLKGK
jgi:hypothetical protein